MQSPALSAGYYIRSSAGVRPFFLSANRWSARDDQIERGRLDGEPHRPALARDHLAVDVEERLGLNLDRDLVPCAVDDVLHPGQVAASHGDRPAGEREPRTRRDGDDVEHSVPGIGL